MKRSSHARVVKVRQQAELGVRVYRFPPLLSRPRQMAADQAGQPLDAQQMQQAVNDGFREGLDKGYAEGLQQGSAVGRREGFEQGREEGRELGLRQGREEGMQRFEQASAPLENVFGSLQQLFDEMEQRRRSELLELVRKVSRQVIRCELTINPAQLLTLAEEALAGMPGDPVDVQVLLSPEEYARIRDIAPERAADWRLVPDERLVQGECRVLTAQAEADIGCQQRLDACMDALGSHLHGEPQEN